MFQISADAFEALPVLVNKSIESQAILPAGGEIGDVDMVIAVLQK